MIGPINLRATDELHQRFDGPTPPQLRPEYQDEQLAKIEGAVETNTCLAQNYEREAKMTTDSDYRERMLANAQWHREAAERWRKLLPFENIPVAAE